MKHEESRQEKYDNRRAAWETRQLEKVGEETSESISSGIAPSGSLDGARSQPPVIRAQLKDFLSNVLRRSAELPYRSSAYESLLLLRGHAILAAKELLFSHCQLLIETQYANPQRGRNDDMDICIQTRSSWMGRLRRLFDARKPYMFRRETWATIVVMLTQQLCGINILIAYSSSLFCDNRSPQSTQPLLVTLAIGLVNFFFAFPAYWWIESRGRRWLLLVTEPFLAIILSAAAGGWRVSDSHTLGILEASLCCIYTAVYSFGAGPVPFTYSAEVFPLEQRMVGMSLAVSINFFFFGLLALFAPLLGNTGHSKLLGVFAALNIVAFLLVFFFVPEVVDRGGRHRRALTLEQLFYIFELPISKNLAYQRSVYLPYLWQWWAAVLARSSKPQAPKLFHRWARDNYYRDHAGR
jgi:hypothetical protein